MNRTEVRELVAASADRFGDANPQQFQQLAFRLANTPPEEVSAGLLSLFMEPNQDRGIFARQELAGRLLATLKPKGHFDLETTLRAILPNYGLSVEQLPSHLVLVHGPGAVAAVLSKLELEVEGERDRRAVQTMSFWLRNAATNASAHGA